MELRFVLPLLAVAGCGGSVAPHAQTPSVPHKPTPRERIEGNWFWNKWYVDQGYTNAPDISGLFSLNGGIATFQLNVKTYKRYIFCIGYYHFTEKDTVLTIGWNTCSQWKYKKDGSVEGDFSDQWDGFVPAFKIVELPNGDLSLKYNTENEHPHEVHHSAFGWDMLFHPDGTLEYWNLSTDEQGRKDNVKYFTKLLDGDPKIPF
jgi:hypothetical protein